MSRLTNPNEFMWTNWSRSIYPRTVRYCRGLNRSIQQTFTSTKTNLVKTLMIVDDLGHFFCLFLSATWTLQKGKSFKLKHCLYVFFYLQYIAFQNVRLFCKLVFIVPYLLCPLLSISTEETCLQGILETLKRSLQNF